jgi:hypothetical protein
MWLANWDLDPLDSLCYGVCLHNIAVVDPALFGGHHSPLLHIWRKNVYLLQKSLPPLLYTVNQSQLRKFFFLSNLGGVIRFLLTTESTH